MNKTIRVLSVFNIFFVYMLVGCVHVHADTVPSVSVSADPSIEQVALSSFDGLSKTQLWHYIDGLPFWAVPLVLPQDYYQSADVSDANELRKSLHEIIDNHIIFPYSHSSVPSSNNHMVDTWDIIALADAHPDSPGQVLDIYLNGTFAVQRGGVNTDPRYDREHSWPKSLGFPDSTTRNPAYTDCHHLFAAYRSYNGSRSNKPYGEGDTDSDKRRATLENMGRGGSLTDEPFTSNYSFADVWQTWLGRRGDVARAMFYMDVRYEGEVIGRIGEADLILTNDVAKIEKKNVWETGQKAYMGMLDVLLEWHKQDPVDDLERRRNAVVYLFQGNRNPFVDHPEWVDVIFNQDSVYSSACEVWINEFHYDNESTDSNEFVEIAGTAGLALSGWHLIGYNGNGGRAYFTVALSGTIQDMSNGFGVLAYDFPSMQNGSPDGIALVNPSGSVVQFLSYESGFTATDGPAEGMVSDEINVSETNNTPSDYSLQLTGQGAQYNDFRWQQPSLSSRGRINNGQMIQK